MTRPRPGRRPAPKLTPVQLTTALAVLAVFIVAVVVGGWIGAILLGGMAIGAGLLLATRWEAVDPRMRIFRLVAVLATLAVAVSLAFRG